eukprot:6347141-Ditylum_brightwellii.AAC.1
MKSDDEDTLFDSASSLEDTRKVRTNKVVRTNRSKPNLVSMSAKDDNMSGVAMQLCDAFTAILNGNGQ